MLTIGTKLKAPRGVFLVENITVKPHPILDETLVVIDALGPEGECVLDAFDVVKQIKSGLVTVMERP